jgi:hypothetical protein
MVWALLLKSCENRTKGENRLAFRTKQVHDTHLFPEMVQIFNSPCLAFQAFRHAKVEMLKFISRNRRENEHQYKCIDIKCMDRGAVVVQLRRHKWLGL